ncbi:MAG: NADPH-dependent FMN reductase [Rhizobacter sp.]|nr:NADPH-dependent FMN reductase [Rhizobacter sp.]
MNVVLLAGSPSSPSRSHALLSHLQHELRRAGALCLTVALRDLPAQALLQADVSHADLQAALARVRDADAVVIATPIYKAAYSGLLKTFLDLLPQDCLAGKAVLPLATGGSIAHLLAIDYALKPVLHALGARHIADAVFVADPQARLQAGGHYEFDPAVIERLDRAVLGVLELAPRSRRNALATESI